MGQNNRVRIFFENKVKLPSSLKGKEKKRKKDLSSLGVDDFLFATTVLSVHATRRSFVPFPEYLFVLNNRLRSSLCAPAKTPNVKHLGFTVQISILSASSSTCTFSRLSPSASTDLSVEERPKILDSTTSTTTSSTSPVHPLSSRCHCLPPPWLAIIILSLSFSAEITIYGAFHYTFEI